MSKIDAEQCELVGGPYDGFVLLPRYSGFVSRYMASRGDERAFMESWSPEGHPTTVQFLEVDLLLADGDRGEAYYRQADDIRWRLVDMEELLS
jgi:hypothetical protein